jgi:TonB family protein
MIGFSTLLAVLAVGAAAQDAPGVYRMGPGITPPRVIQKSEPVYSEEARKSRLVGDVGVKVTVGEDGVPRDLAVTKPLGLGLDEQALNAVSTWRFAPGTKDGKPVAVFATIQVTFRIADKLPWRLGGATCNLPAGAARPAVIQRDYPTDKAAPGEKASVAVSFDLDESGKPANLHVEKSSDEKWEKEAIAAMREWKFRPASTAVRCTWTFIQNE